MQKDIKINFSFTHLLVKNALLEESLIIIFTNLPSKYWKAKKQLAIYCTNTQEWNGIFLLMVDWSEPPSAEWKFPDKLHSVALGKATLSQLKALLTKAFNVILNVCLIWTKNLFYTNLRRGVQIFLQISPSPPCDMNILSTNIWLICWYLQYSPTDIWLIIIGWSCNCSIKIIFLYMTCSRLKFLKLLFFSEIQIIKNSNIEFLTKSYLEVIHVAT